VQTFIRIAEKSGCDFSLLKEVGRINQRRVEHFLEKVRQEVWVVRDKQIAVWGLALKPNTDDVRFAPSIALVKSLLDEGAHVRGYDPQAMEKAKSVLPSITYCSNPYEAAEGADAIVIVTEWDEFGQVDWDRLRSAVERPLVVDGRNMLDATEVTRRGFHYVSVGRIPMMPEQSPSMANDVQTFAGVQG
jgi:UDPglucose 6-dehydrogenase